MTAKGPTRKNDWLPDTYYVTKGYTILKTNFATRDEALKWVQDFARQRGGSGKQRFVPQQLSRVRRTGPDYRGKRDVIGQDYLDAFAFRGGEFGNWMTQNDRRASLNMGFDALKDLAAVLQISEKDISYQGTLDCLWCPRQRKMPPPTMNRCGRSLTLPRCTGPVRWRMSGGMAWMITWV